MSQKKTQKNKEGKGWITKKELKLALKSNFWLCNEEWGRVKEGLAPESLIAQSRGCQFETLYEKILHPKDSEFAHRVLHLFARCLGYASGTNYLQDLGKIGAARMQEKIKLRLKGMK